MTIQKRYMVDNGLLNLFLYNGETKLLENMVAIELNRRFRNTPEDTLLYYYNKTIEIDFCVPSERLAIQVAYNLCDTATYEREVGGITRFLKVFPAYQGLIITRDEEKEIPLENHTIQVIPIWKWLFLRHNINNVRVILACGGEEIRVDQEHETYIDFIRVNLIPVSYGLSLDCIFQ